MTKAKGKVGVKGKDQLATLGDVQAAWSSATGYADEVGKAVYAEYVRRLEVRVTALDYLLEKLEKRVEKLEKPWWRVW